MRRFFVPVLAFSLVAAPATLEAQTPRAERGQPGAGPGARGPAAANPAARVLEHREALGLTLDQVRQLQQIQAQLDSRNQPLLDELQAARPAMRGMGQAMRGQQMRGQQMRGQQMTPQQREQMRAQMETRRAEMEARREQMQQHRQPMTPEQREQMRAQMETRRAEMEARREQMRNATPEQREELRRQMQEQMRGQGRMQDRGPGATAGARMNPELRQQFEALRPVMQQLQESNTQARRDVQAVLTAEQQQTLRELRQQRGQELRQQLRQRLDGAPARPGMRQRPAGRGAGR